MTMYKYKKQVTYFAKDIMYRKGKMNRKHDTQMEEQKAQQ